ncbi:MAG: NagC family transcriptional regulator [Ardenticatenaceae bacterium]|nr:MAG: NagC family transcriptional regulator [Ardenticatenaceae bacterium]
MQDADLFVGLDVGGTKTAVLVVNAAGYVQSQAVVPTRTAHPDALLDTINRAIQVALTAAKATPARIRSIGLGIPGQVNPATGIVKMAVNLNLQSYSLGAAISNQFNVPALIENDARTATVGAFNYLRQTEPIQSMAYLSVGTGLSAGVILNGHLYRGHNGMAGEIGHMPILQDGEICKCGLHGCLETIVSGPAIVRQMAATLPSAQTSFQNAGNVYEEAAQGNTAAQAVIQYVSQHLSRAIQWLILTYDVEKIVLGGGVTRSGAKFLAPILQELTILRQQSTLAAEMLQAEKLYLVSHKHNPGEWGAVHLAAQAVSEELTIFPENDKGRSTVKI